MNKKLSIIAILLVVLALLLAACGPGSTELPAAGETPVAEAGMDIDELVAALEAAGLAPEVAGAEDGLGNPLFDVTPEMLDVKGEQIQVYAFESAEAAQEAAATVNAEGNIIGNVMVDWAEPPHFYQAGSLVVVYAGESEEILSTLQGTLGEPFVVGSGLFGPIDEEESGDNG